MQCLINKGIESAVQQVNLLNKDNFFIDLN